MSAGTQRPVPEEGLVWKHDDPEDPAELTVFTPDRRRTTEWITVDEEAAVSPERMR